MVPIQNFKIEKFVCLVCHFLKNDSSYGNNVEGRTSTATIFNYRRAIFRVASNSHDSADKIKSTKVF